MAMTRVSAGIYKDANGNIIRSANGAMNNAPTNTNPEALARQKLEAQNRANKKAMGGASSFYQAPQSLYDSSYRVTEGGNNQANSVLNNANSVYGRPFDLSGIVANRPTGAGLEGERSRIEDSLYGRYTKDMDRRYSQDREMTNQELQNRGIPVGSQAYSNTMNDLNTRYDNQRESARSLAVENGGSEWSRSYGIGQDAINQRVGDYTTGYTMPADIAGRLASIGQGNQLGINQQQLYQDENKFNQTLGNQKYEFGKTYGLEQKRLAMAGRGGGGYRQPQAPQPQYPTFGGGLPTGYVPTQQAPRRDPAGNLFNSAVSGAVAGATNSFFR